jgi:hypothetical protein
MSDPALPIAPGPDEQDHSAQAAAGRGLWGRLRHGRLFVYLAIAGPGIIAANAGNDAAGIATYASAGSQFVYRTLFFVLLVTVALMLVQEMACGWVPTQARGWPP